ncbi:glycosyltransferase family 9 protein [Lichenicola sp.]|uniref:glycosyltransferase family 9 protein n=1 Tax=Lichenicola sp. TaxID=2804529 RepID=UPI003B007BED
MKRILVIKLGALGDFVLAFAPFAAIRAHHPHDHITLLTTAPFVGLATASPWFDAVAIDARPSWWDLPALARLRGILRGQGFIYDLQTSGRSSRYFHLTVGTGGPARPGWSGIAVGASHPDSDPARDRLHTRTRQTGQLARAGIAVVPDPDLAWLARAESPLPGSDRIALLVPGAAMHRPGKRWPVARFAALAAVLAEGGLQPVVVGGAPDADAAAAIAAHCPGAIDLTGRTSLLQLGALAARAEVAIGNDTGPMHLAAAMGCRSIVLFGPESDPALTAPIGRTPGQVSVVRVPDLAGLPVDRVAALLA